MSNLRKQLKTARKSITGSCRHQCDLIAWDQLSRSRLFQNATHIASYHAVNGEYPTGFLNRQILNSGKHLYLPLLATRPANHLEFQLWNSHTPFISNRFGIPEPVRDVRRQRPARQLDLVITPLLGFDVSGSRMGMGGGFYDRSFAFLHGRRNLRTTLLVGLAFEAQKLERIPRQTWDVPLDGILTENGLTLFRQGCWQQIAE